MQTSLTRVSTPLELLSHERIADLALPKFLRIHTHPPPLNQTLRGANYVFSVLLRARRLADEEDKRNAEGARIRHQDVPSRQRRRRFERGLMACGIGLVFVSCRDGLLPL